MGEPRVDAGCLHLSSFAMGPCLSINRATHNRRNGFGATSRVVRVVRAQAERLQAAMPIESSTSRRPPIGNRRRIADLRVALANGRGTGIPAAGRRGAARAAVDARPMTALARRRPARHALAGLCRRGGDPLRARFGWCRPSASWRGSPISAARNGIWCRRRWCSSRSAIADWSRGGARAKARLSFVFGQAAYVFASVALSGLFVNVVKVLFGRARPRLIDQVGAYHFDPLTLRLSQCELPVRPLDHGRRDRRHPDRLVSALVAADHRARPVLRRDQGRGAGALSVRRGRRLSHRHVLLDRPGALARQARRRLSLRARENPAGSGRPAGKKIPVFVDARAPAFLGRSLAGKRRYSGPGCIGPAGHSYLTSGQ